MFSGIKNILSLFWEWPNTNPQHPSSSNGQQGRWCMPKRIYGKAPALIYKPTREFQDNIWNSKWQLWLLTNIKCDEQFMAADKRIIQKPNMIWTSDHIFNKLESNFGWEEHWVKLIH